MLGIIAGCLVVCICALIYRRSRLQGSPHPLPPAAPGILPIIGHTHLLLTDTSTLWLRVKKFCDFSMQQGGVIYAQFGFDIYYFVSDPEDAIVVANTCLKKHFLYEFARYWLGDGLITGSGDHWSRHRQLLKQSFSLPIINGYLEVFNSQARMLLNALESSTGKGQIYPTPEVKKFSLGSSYLTTFGKHANDEKIFKKYLKATDEMLSLVMERFQKVWLHNEFTYGLLGYKKQEAELLECRDEVADEIIQTKKTFFNETYDESTYIPYRPLLHLILEQHTNNQFTEQEISEELHTAIVAAYETTAGSLQSILVLIGSFPKVQEKIYEEVMQVLGTDRDVDKEDLRKLVYTEAVVKESLRLLPTVPIIGRYIDRDLKLSKTYAMTALKIAVAHIVRKFIITGDYTKLQYQLDITLKPFVGHDISLERRS
ncbi:hypothetical protein PYW07_010001 [Mythimna separata]|uniref:Cytochrome P450 n=1 Tax=Mythimna separata TaxID=271217 RepID=A0AAD8DQL7_MYTSE|nr:hypothetical protein PYW07_010001 [Mythimna separata]